MSELLLTHCVLFKKSQNSLEGYFDKQEVMLGKLWAFVCLMLHRTTQTTNDPDQSVNIMALQDRTTSDGRKNMARS